NGFFPNSANPPCSRGSRRHSRNWGDKALFSHIGQTAKNSRKALTSVLPSITDMARPRGNAPSPYWPSRCELFLVRSLPVFGKKSQMVGSRLLTADRRRCRMVDGRRVGTGVGDGQVRELLDILTGFASFEGRALRPIMVSYS